MLHGTLTIITPIRSTKHALQRLRGALAEVSRDPAAYFAGIPGLHFARWAILDRGPEDEERRLDDMSLVFSADFGGRGRRRTLVSDFIHQLVTRLKARGDGLLDRIYGCCEGYPGPAPEALEAYLARSAWGYQARHVAFAYRAAPVEAVRESVRLLDDAMAWLNARRAGGMDVDALQRELRARHPRLFEGALDEDVAVARREAVRATVVYPLAHPVLLLARGFRELVLKLQRRMRRTSQVARGHVNERRIAPDAPVQNPMVHVASLDLGWLRRAVFKGLLRLVDLRMRRYLVGLNHITSIHCARWAIYRTPAGRRRLLFLSNYDGSWGAYIGSFVDSPDVGEFLDLMWSQTKEFPGAADVEAFMAWIQARQFQTLVWHSAYRDLGDRSIADIQQALHLRALLRDGDRAALRRFVEVGACEPELMALSWTAAVKELVAGWMKGLGRRTEHVEAREQARLGAGRRAEVQPVARREAHAAGGA